MQWTTQDKLTFLMGVPWTVSIEADPDGGLVARVSEVPFLIATGANEKALGKDIYDALMTALSAMLAHGDPLPLPVGTVAPWMIGREPPSAPEYKSLRGIIVETTPTASAVAQSLSLSFAVAE